MKEFYEVSSVGELKKLGELSELVKQLEKIVVPLKVTADSYEELLAVISTLKENWLPFKKGYFVSKRAEYIYYLLEHEGERREKLLGIDDEIYSDKKVAKKWYKRIAQIVHPDFGTRDSEQAKEAFQKLQDIYQDLTDDEAFGGIDE
ncbi:DnaJ domain-containing protein [Larsenimonas rhizosphaerae]|uniref:DnaJ domain-containing protein n=1 Tax=Larsenimonas rhizosphaerae TaxID=2944682 RepID=UPI0020342B06|nr:DnaJ domain-containing protein [Larsenimonas rhizosphaerae]MCM2130036.1 DnaJ domain-containing protein [Larsenimonas rhizosphaerae]